MELLKDYILTGKDIRSNEQIAKHADWVDEFLPNYTSITEENVEEILQQEVGKVFCEVLKMPEFISVMKKDWRHSIVL